MIRDFSLIWQSADRLLDGLINTVLLSLVGAVLALALGALLAIPLMASNPVLRLVSRGFVDLMRCVPFLMLTYLVYYGLPRLGLRFDNWTAGLVAIVVYNTAYMAEIIRGIWSRLERETIEAAVAFGFHGWRLVSRIILPQIVLAAGPMIGNQLIQIIKDTAFLTIIAVPELTHAANSIQAQYFIPFATFITAVLLYWALCMLVEVGVYAVERIAEKRR
ncbi:amino acid ABC transporter permease [Ancylobacter sonchi]|uniref:amino acid ABC transporter permease n=1 Tax=Ancylobacter TaxID=99 RepID=UPI001BD614DF|nr:MULTISPECIES: amino acid ABC transporter permease [Ancylobacter]MBS7534701.1 amino acid ABC transporter permease [Ancylobacter sonchi]MCB4767909.1 amino acid ABC transporter permease [Ancylobacter sp. Lp-2]